MIKVRSHAPAAVMKRENRASVVLEVGVRTIEIPCRVDPTGQAVHAAMVVSVAPASLIVATRRMVWRARRICQGPKIIVERMILLHEDDDVIYLVHVATGKQCRRHGHD